MKTIFPSLFFVVIAFTTAAQTGDLKMVKTFGGYKFESDGNILKPREVLTLMESDPEAYAAFKKAKSNYDAGSVLGFVGGFMIGWPLGTALGGGDPQWGLAAGGVAVLLLGIPLNSAFKKHARTAVELYNGKTVRHFNPSFRVDVYGAGAKLTMRF
jgi:hypothetical protein